ncbi:MAG TPA: beta-N-acetylhexosaminidase [Bryobacteraceae bacterium]
MKTINLREKLSRTANRTSLVLCALAICSLHAETVSPLSGRGYAVIPEPQQVRLSGGDFVFSSAWRLQLMSGVKDGSAAVETLQGHLKNKDRVQLAGSGKTGPALVLEIKSGAVQPGASQDRDKAEIQKQAYRIVLRPTEVHITGNTETGLFYGVQTFLQLLKPASGALWLPQGEIVDWPDLEMRNIYWDDAHHLEKLDVLKEAVREASYFKINGFVIKLEGHFEYAHAPALVEPQALSPAQFQELTDYGLRYHVQVVPYLDAPAHIAFILKHPEYAKLREFPESNYELCMTNPDSLKLLYGMYDDLLAANRGVKYFYLSTDEAYYAGLADNSGCHEAQRAKELGSPGKVLAEFLTKTAGYLHDRGRSVVFWGEYPLKPEDIPSLPNYLINGETYGPKFDPEFRRHGMRQMIYTSTEGEERMFPQYFRLPSSRLLHPLQENTERIRDATHSVATNTARKDADLMGLVIAGWADMGLHPATFWLGYATITASGWKPWTVDASQAMSAFFPLFYGHDVTNMSRLYQLMSLQAQTWMDSWETVDSKSRKPIWGNSYKIFSPPEPAHDQSIPLPGVPSADLSYTAQWSKDNARRLGLANTSLVENDELLGLLNANLQRAESHRYGLAVFLSIARLCRQNLELLTGFGRIDHLLAQAADSAKSGKADHALAQIDAALAAARAIRHERNVVLRDATATWYETWLPRVEEANGRRFLHELDDVKDHLPDRTVDMSYLVYRELQLPLDDWYRQTQQARNAYAAAHHLPQSTVPLSWKSLD